MGKEVPGFYISDEVVKSLEQGFDLDSEAQEAQENLRDYISRILTRMSLDHPSLYSLIESASAEKPQASVYLTSAALTYDVITSQLSHDGKKVTITEDDVKTYQQRLNADPDQEWFVDKLAENSKAFTRLIWATLEQLDSDLQQEIFSQGVFDAAIPLFTKIEEIPGLVENLKEKEKQFVVETFSSAMEFSAYQKSFIFPRKKKDFVMVDIGAGASDTTAVLASQGARAIAIDPRYEHIGDLFESMNEIYTNKYFRWKGRAVERFKDDFKKSGRRGKGTYIAALAGDLPFANESVDFVYSMRCILFFLDQDWDLLKRAIDESWRVLKKGGEIQLAPFFPASLGVDTVEQVEHLVRGSLRAEDSEFYEALQIQEENKRRLLKYAMTLPHALEPQIRTLKDPTSRVEIPLTLQLKKG